MSEFKREKLNLEADEQGKPSKENFHFTLDGDLLSNGSWRIYYGAERQYSFEAPANSPIVRQCDERNALLDRFSAAGGDPALLRHYHKTLYDLASKETHPVMKSPEWSGMTRDLALGITDEKIKEALYELFSIDQRYNNQHTLNTSAMASASCAEIPKYSLLLNVLKP